MCKLKKALYGLKQSTRAWFRKFTSAVIKFGLRRSAYDHSVFFQSSNVGCILLVVYVDDIVTTGSDKPGIERLKSFIGTCFQTKHLGRCSSISWELKSLIIVREFISLKGNIV